MSSPSSLIRPQPPVWSPLGDFPFCGYTPSPCHTVGSWLGTDTFPALSHRSLPWCRRPYAESPAGAHVRFLPRRHWPSPCSNGLGAPTFPQLAMSTPQRGLLVGDRHDAAAIRLTLRPQGLLAPLDQPTSTPVGPGRRALVLPGFHAQGSPPGRAGYDYLGNRKTPRAGLSPAGSMLLWAALERRSNDS